MNAKKAKAIRKIAEMLDLYTPTKQKEYKVIKNPKMVRFLDDKGKPQMIPIEKKQYINAKKYIVNQITQLYNDGAIGILSLKDLHTMTPEEVSDFYKGEF